MWFSFAPVAECCHVSTNISSHQCCIFFYKIFWECRITIAGVITNTNKVHTKDSKEIAFDPTEKRSISANVDIGPKRRKLGKLFASLKFTLNGISRGER